MSDHIASLEVRHDAPSVIHNLPQEELLYMRIKGLSWKDVEEADKARARRKKAAAYAVFLMLSGLLCFLLVRAYPADETTSPSSEFFVSTDKPGVLNSTHEWLDARPVGHNETASNRSSSGHDSRSRSGSGRGSDVDWDSGFDPGEETPREDQDGLGGHGSTPAHPPAPSTRSRSRYSTTSTTNASASANLTEPDSDYS
ncbi:uncharacterized protein LOC144118725 isoform X2 [Amblyomma americanum]